MEAVEPAIEPPVDDAQAVDEAVVEDWTMVQPKMCRPTDD